MHLEELGLKARCGFNSDEKKQLWEQTKKVMLTSILI